MAKQRYTLSDLQREVTNINANLTKAGCTHRVTIEQFNNATYLYKATPEQILRRETSDMIDGQPKIADLRYALYRFAYFELTKLLPSE